MASTSSKRAQSSQLSQEESHRLAPESARPQASVDVPHAVRGASSGFSVLLIGGLVAPMVGIAAPLLGSVWLTLTAVVGFVVAARRIGVATVPALHGAVAAVLAYILVLPLLLPFEAGRNVPQILLTLATAISVGACTGWIQSRHRPRT
jgi:hypothetical protein